MTCSVTTSSSRKYEKSVLFFCRDFLSSLPLGFSSLEPQQGCLALKSPQPCLSKHLIFWWNLKHRLFFNPVFGSFQNKRSGVTYFMVVRVRCFYCFYLPKTKNCYQTPWTVNLRQNKNKENASNPFRNKVKLPILRVNAVVNKFSLCAFTKRLKNFHSLWLFYATYFYVCGVYSAIFIAEHCISF